MSISISPTPSITSHRVLNRLASLTVREVALAERTDRARRDLAELQSEMEDLRGGAGRTGSAETQSGGDATSRQGAARRTAASASASASETDRKRD